MAMVPRESLQIEPAVRAKAANKELTRKNNRASNNWQKVKRALERDKLAWTKGAEDDRSKLLKHREKLRKTSLSLTTRNSAHVDEEANNAGKPRVSLRDVYEALMKSAMEHQDAASDIKSVRSEPALALTTQSFERKRIGRKPIKFSLQGLQQANNNLQTKLNAIEKTVHESLGNDDERDALRKQSQPPSPFDLNEEERRLGPTLKLPPHRLPPINRSTTFKPSVRTFNKDEKYKQRVRGNDFSMDDIRYCRYLRERSCSEPKNTYYHGRGDR